MCKENGNTSFANVKKILWLMESTIWLESCIEFITIIFENNCDKIKKKLSLGIYVEKKKKKKNCNHYLSFAYIRLTDLLQISTKMLMEGGKKKKKKKIKPTTNNTNK